MPHDDESIQQNWKNTPEKCTSAMVEAGVHAMFTSKTCAEIYEAMLAAAPQQPKEAIPPAVVDALDRMCIPLHESHLKGVTAQEDARCMAIIRDYIFNSST